MRPTIVQLLVPAVGDRLASYLAPKGTTLLVAAIGIVLWVMVARGRKFGMPVHHIVGAAVAAVVAGLVGARSYFLLQHLPQVAAHPGALIDLTGGTTSWGGYIGGILGYSAYLRRQRQPLLVHLDLLASSLGLGPAIARWGCLMSGCCWGAHGNPPWAIRFPRGSFAHVAQVRDGLLTADAPTALPVHPVQVYASLAGVTVFVAASLFWRRNRQRPGLTFAFYWIVYGTLRYLTEFFRGDVARFGVAQLTQSQFVALGLVFGGLLALGWLSGRGSLCRG